MSDTKRGHVSDLVDASEAVTLVAPVQATPSVSLRPTSYPERYLGRELIGEGGMGTVFLHRDAQIGRSVAVKKIRPELRHDPAASARFVREARVQGQLEHPAIVPVYDLSVDADGAEFFSMKAVRGETLFDILKELRLGDEATCEAYPRHRLLTAFVNVCQAVEYAHERGVIHRDLKPDNIMLGDYGELYVLDWGIAKIMGEADVPRSPESRKGRAQALTVEAHVATSPGEAVGTPGYMAPEQLLGEPDDVGPTSDVYALGAILFEILTLAQLHGGKSMREAVASYGEPIDVLAAIAASGAEVPPELAAICRRATELDPAARYPRVREMRQAVERYLQGERDVALRRELAAKHVAAAREHAQRAQRSEGDLDARRAAMEELSQALALDPEGDAVDILVLLMSQPMREVPLEVEGEMARSLRSQHRQTALIGAIVNPSLIVFLPIIWWVGIRDTTALWLFYVLAMLCGLGSWITHRAARPSTSAVLAVMFLSHVMYVCTWQFVGPFLLLPLLIVANTMAFAIQLERGPRLLATASGLLALFVPFALEITGVVEPSFYFEGGVLHLPSQALVSSQRVLALLLPAFLTALVAGVAVVGRVRDALYDAERTLHLYTWHLRQFVPAAARAATSSVTARTPSTMQGELDGVAQRILDQRK